MIKSNLIITEKQNLQSYREGNYYFGSLSSAKRLATKNQVFCGTVLTIENDEGLLLSYKKDGCRWVDVF